MKELKFKGLYKFTDIKSDKYKNNIYTAYYTIGTKPVLIRAVWVAEDLQYTGFKDYENNNIYEDDILKCYCNKTDMTDPYNPINTTIIRYSVIEWWQSHVRSCYRLRDGKGKTMLNLSQAHINSMKAVVTGNKIVNPELLKI